MKQTIPAVALTLLVSGAAFAQSTAPRPQFEAASVKPAPPPSGMMMRVRMGGDKGRIDYNNVTIRDVIVQAYNVKDYQITAPDWMRSARFNIVATMPEDTSKEQARLMLQSLLADRFHLELHRDTKDLPIYVLTVAKNGPKLKESEIQAPAGSENRGRMMMRPGALEGKGMGMAQFSELLARQLGRPVEDKTGLPGSYDFTLEYTPDENQRAAMMAGMPAGMPGPMMRPDGGGGGGGNGDGRAPEGGPSIFAALQEQLGLKLDSRKGPVEILVIDRAEKIPTEN